MVSFLFVYAGHFVLPFRLSGHVYYNYTNQGHILDANGRTAINQTRERVGVLDPSFSHEVDPFFFLLGIHWCSGFLRSHSILRWYSSSFLIYRVSAIPPFSVLFPPSLFVSFPLVFIHNQSHLRIGNCASEQRSAHRTCVPPIPVVPR